MANNPFDEVAKLFAENMHQIERQVAEFQAELAKILSDPQKVGWIRLLEVLENSAGDKQIISSPGAREFLELMIELTRGAVNLSSSAEEAIQPLAGEFISKNSSKMSKKRFAPNMEVRQWVIEEWTKDKAAYKGKADFARIFVGRILKEYGLRFTERTISGVWLKGL